jgi:RNA polymerase sigma-70 factor (ECF subfamily)
MAVPGDGALSDAVYRELKPLLFSLAYRMLGSVMDAEDIVHESFLALDRAGRDHVANVQAYLCRAVTNRCLNHLQSSAKKREVYPGPWLPEPLVGEAGRAVPSNDPLQTYVHKESLGTAYLLLLQQLSYVERAVFLLREVLGYGYDEIAGIVGKSSVNCRQIYHRAKRSLGNRASAPATDGDAPAADRAAPARLVEQFVRALASADVDGLMRALSADTALTIDGGGKVAAPPRTVVGAKRIAVFLATMPSVLPADAAWLPAVVNGGPGIVVQTKEQTIAVASIDIEGDRIAAIYVVANPDKLRHVERMAE